MKILKCCRGIALLSPWGKNTAFLTLSFPTFGAIGGSLATVVAAQQAATPSDWDEYPSDSEPDFVVH
jgi:hypothetical protein